MKSNCTVAIRIPVAIACAFLAIALTDAPSDAYTIHTTRPDTPDGFLAPPNLVTKHIVAQNDYIRCREPVYDFGTLRGSPDRKLWHSFEIENISDRPVRIQVIEALVGTLRREDPWINPGESIFVGIQTSIGFDGDLSKQVEVRVIELGEPAE